MRVTLTSLSLAAIAALAGACDYRDVADAQSGQPQQTSPQVAPAPDDHQGAEEAVAVQGASNLPDFTLNDQKGNPVSLRDHKGKIVVLEWVNFDCPFVRPHYESGTFKKLAEKYKPEGVVWLAVNSTNYATVENNRQATEKYDVPYPILDDHAGSVGRHFEASNTPHMFIFDRQGNQVYEGAIDNAPAGNLPQGAEYTNYVDEVLAALTSGRELEPIETKPYGCTVKYPR